MVFSTPSMAALLAGNANSNALSSKSYAQAMNKKKKHPVSNYPCVFLLILMVRWALFFSESKVAKTVEEFRFSLLMKFMRNRPSIDKIQLNVVTT